MRMLLGDRLWSAHRRSERLQNSSAQLAHRSVYHAEEGQLAVWSSQPNLCLLNNTPTILVVMTR